MVASPVFKAMFSSRFLEGSTERSPQHPYELCLPDDDAGALEVLLRVLHFSNKRKIPEIGNELVLKIAQLADKYDCVAAIQDSSERWLRILSDSRSSDPLTLATACFILEHRDLFQITTHKITSTYSENSLSDVLLKSGLPPSLKGMFTIV